MSSDKVQILVVDDDISHCTILQALLRGWGYQVGLAHRFDCLHIYCICMPFKGWQVDVKTVRCGQLRLSFF